MKPSRIELINGSPVLCVGNEKIPACAYITYFDERNDYEAFTSEGFRLYSISISLASQPINTMSGFIPYLGGVFDKKGEADFSAVDESFEKVLDACPNAYIFPRIHVCMPEWWIEENPEETVLVPHGKRRESLYSEKFRETAAEMLTELVEHFKKSPYSDNILGYQISGGNTQEWFHLDNNGSYSEHTLPYFNKYLQKKHPGTPEVKELPSLDDINESVLIESPLLTEYLRFASDEVAKTIDYLCLATKKAVDFSQIVGVFYGYTCEVNDPLSGTHALASVIDSPNIDFFSSPNSYVAGRSLGNDWADMMPVDSIKLHNKMCFIECDIRTYLTLSPGDSRPGCDPLKYYTNKLWAGPPTEELSVWAVRKSLARQLTHKHGLWWFDMFGHWFASDGLMKEMSRSLELYSERLKESPVEFPVEVAVFVDETTYSKMGKKHPAHTSAYHLRTSLGKSGAPYDVYLIEDFEKVCNEKAQYKAVIFNIPVHEGQISEMAQKLEAKGVKTLCVTEEKPMYSEAELCDFFKECGVFVYTDEYDVLYIGNGYVGVHAAADGEKSLHFPKTLKITDTESGESVVTDTLKFKLSQFETKLFRLSNV